MLRGGGVGGGAEPAAAPGARPFGGAGAARRITAGETGSPLRPWSETVATLQVMDRVRDAVGLDFAEARAARNAALG